METATIRIPEEKRNLLKTVACLEKRKMNDLLVDLIDEYIDRRKESLELMAIPGLYESVRTASREFRARKSVSLRDAKERLAR